MTRSLGGRTVLSSRARRRAFPAAINSTAAGEPCFCTCTGTPQEGVLYGSGASFTAGVSGVEDYTAALECDPYRGALCSSDMAATITVSTLPTGSGSPSCDVGVGVRYNANGSAGYLYYFTYNTTAPFSTFFLLEVGSYSFLASSSFPTAAAPGDTLELSIVGSALTAKHNGATMFSVTDTTVPSSDAATFGYFTAGSSVSFTGSLVVADFSVTPICP